MGRPKSTNYLAILREIREEKTAKQIALSMNISVAQVYKVAKVYNIKIATPTRKTNPLINQIIQRVLETGNGYLVDKEFGLCLGGAKRICRQNGVSYPLRFGRLKSNKPLVHGVGKGNNNPRKIHLPNSVGEMYLGGLGEKEIAEQFGISRKVVRKKLVQLNIPKRVGKAKGPKNPQWKGGREVTVYKYRRQAYEVVAICLKRPLQEGYVIHHIDENPKNNNPSNLMIFPSGSLHAKFHQTVLKNRWIVDSEIAIQEALRIGGVPLPIPDFQIEL